jgi:hypothetical protein
VLGRGPFLEAVDEVDKLDKVAALLKVKSQGKWSLGSAAYK